MYAASFISSLESLASSRPFLLSRRLENLEMPSSESREEYREMYESPSRFRLPYFGVVDTSSLNESLQLDLGVGDETADDSASLQLDRGVGVDASNLDVPDDPDSETVETGLEPYFVRLEFESELLRLLRQDGL